MCDQICHVQDVYSRSTDTTTTPCHGSSARRECMRFIRVGVEPRVGRWGSKGAMGRDYLKTKRQCMEGKGCQKRNEEGRRENGKEGFDKL